MHARELQELHIGKLVLLFRVVSRICEDAGEDTACNSVCAFHDNAITVCAYKLIIKQNVPHSMEELAATVCQDG